jgi:hypothetical protein
MLIPFGPWTPDQPKLGSASIEALNCIPAVRSKKPFPAYGAFSTTPLDAKCQGAAAFRSNLGALGLYAGDAGKLYRADNTDWTDASKVGGYTTDVAGRWNSVSYGALALFINGADPIQKITIDGGTIFADLGGSPPIGRYIAVCKDYVIVGWLSTDSTAAQWCETNDPEGWSIGSGGGDIQPIPDCGQVTGVIGGDFFLVLLERGVHRFDFIGGDIVFQRRQISAGVGCSIPGTANGFNDRAFFYHTTGFYQCISGSAPIPIGNERVNDYFAGRLSAGGDSYVFSAIDPNNSLYLVGFCSTGASGFPVTEIMAFKWDIGQIGEWTHVIDGAAYDCLFSGLSAINVTMADLDVYGSLEDVPATLDSAAWLGTGQQLCGAFGSDHNAGWFNGANMPATLTTTEAVLTEGQKSLVRGWRPIVEGAALANITGTVYGRNTLADMVATNPNSQDKAPNARGIIRARLKSRYHRAEIVIDDANWTHAAGIDDLEFYPVGSR